MKILLNYSPTMAHANELAAAAPGATFSIATDEESACRFIADADAVLGNRYFLQSIEGAQRLRWFQSNSVGMDLVLRAGNHLRDVTVTNARGVYSAEMAEHAVALVFSLFRRLHEFRDRQLRREWAPRTLDTIAGATFLILGWGSVGSAIGQRLHALGANVRGVGRARTIALAAGGSEIPDDAGNWRVHLARVDCVVMALPLTSETRGIVGRDEIARLRSTAFVVNVGRGQTLDEAALIEALNESRLAGAAIDVLDEEPPDASSPIWTAPALVVTPHVARSREEKPPYKWEPLFVENVRRFAAGLPLLNVVDLEREY